MVNIFSRNKPFIDLLAVISVILLLLGIREFYLHGYLFLNFIWSFILWTSGWALLIVVLLLKEAKITRFLNGCRFKINLSFYAMIILLGIILRIILFDLPGYTSYDAWNYVSTGHYLDEGWIPYKDPNIHPEFLTQYAPFFYILLDWIINPSFELNDWRVLINLLDIFIAVLLVLIPKERFSKLIVSFAYLFNPLIFFETAWNGHNDILVVFFLLLGMVLIKGIDLQRLQTIRSPVEIFEHKKTHMVLFFVAGVSFGLSVMIKWISVPIILIIIIKKDYSKLNRLSLIIGSLLTITVTMGYYFILGGSIFLENIWDIVIRGGNPFLASSLTAVYYQILQRFHLPIFLKWFARVFFYGHILGLILLYSISDTKYASILEKKFKMYKVIHIISYVNFIVFVSYFISLSTLNFVFGMEEFKTRIFLVLNLILLIVTLLMVKLDDNLIFNTLIDPETGRINELNIITYISMILVLSVLKTWPWYSVLPISLLLLSKNKKMSLLWILYLMFQAYYSFNVPDFSGEGWFISNWLL